MVRRYSRKLAIHGRGRSGQGTASLLLPRLHLSDGGELLKRPGLLPEPGRNSWPLRREPDGLCFHRANDSRTHCAAIGAAASKGRGAPLRAEIFFLYPTSCVNSTGPTAGLSPCWRLHKLVMNSNSLPGKKPAIRNMFHLSPDRNHSRVSGAISGPRHIELRKNKGPRRARTQLYPP